MKRESLRRVIWVNKILLFANLKEEAGESSIHVEAAGKTVGELRAMLEKETQLKSLEGVMVAVNEEFAKDHVVIGEHDEIALIPPVSGG